jgi:hypothetical protein
MKVLVANKPNEVYSGVRCLKDLIKLLSKNEVLAKEVFDCIGLWLYQKPAKKRRVKTHKTYGRNK